MNHALPSAVTAAVFAPRQSLVTGIAKLPHPQISEKAAADPMAISKSEQTVPEPLMADPSRFGHFSISPLPSVPQCLRPWQRSSEHWTVVKIHEAAGDQIWRNEQVIHDIHVLLGRHFKGHQKTCGKPPPSKSFYEPIYYHWAWNRASPKNLFEIYIYIIIHILYINIYIYYILI
jgi:hypothetical protein